MSRQVGRLAGATVLVLVLAPALAGCTAEAEPDADAAAPVVQLGAPGEDARTLSPEDLAAVEQPGHTEADVEFVQGMIPHHRQALEMTALVGERTASDQIPLLAERIEVSQTGEIDQLVSWLDQRGESLPDEHAHHGDTAMPGMMNGEELAQLENARGARFDRLFLRYMIRHHEGALVMVEELYAEEGGQEPEVFQLAQHIASDQQVEISRMKRMLADL